MYTNIQKQVLKKSKSICQRSPCLMKTVWLKLYIIAQYAESTTLLHSDAGNNIYKVFDDIQCCMCCVLCVLELLSFA